MGIKVGMVGLGSFAQSFIPLFKAHPLVDEIVLCDLDPEKLEMNTKKYNVNLKSGSLDHLLTTNVDAVVIITQNWMHGPQAAKALKAGKHVYSAVPMGIDTDEIKAVIKAAEDSGKIYMMGETSYYYPETVYCRDKFKNGEFGHIVYGEGEYYHDWDHGLYDVAKWRGGEKWLETAGGPPMHYPTHSVSMIVSVTGAHMKRVSCLGFKDKKDMHIYGTGSNIWGNEFSNQTALFYMSDGSSCRINEFRRIGHTGTVRMSLFGTEASFEHNTAGAAWVTKQKTDRVDDLLTVSDRRERIDAVINEIPGCYAKIHAAERERLPKEFYSLPNGHEGSHQFLVDDFVKACVYNKQPPVNAWEAARYTVPGIIAHESSLRGGEALDIPDFGRPASD
jgi:predicted dehydrogenase